MIKAFFVDFYGTVVHEDGEIIKKITQIIYDTGKVENKSEIGASSVNIKALWLNRFGKEIPDGVESITNLLDALDKVN